MSNWQQEGQGGGAAEGGDSMGGGTEESENESPREDAPNPTQEAIDEGGPSDKPADVDWEETESSPHAGEAGQSQDPA